MEEEVIVDEDTEREPMGPPLEEQTVEEKVVGVAEREPMGVPQDAVLVEGEVVDTEKGPVEEDIVEKDQWADENERMEVDVVEKDKLEEVNEQVNEDSDLTDVSDVEKNDSSGGRVILVGRRRVIPVERGRVR